jgi:murein DD-endopeptidase MepM/ murein hydrolase activator NlpD
VSGGGSDAITLYTVRDGDSLSEIAEMFDVSVNTILWANDIKDAKLIKPGMQLLILPVSGVKYTVKKGGTLSDVAKLFNADVDEIALFNGIAADAPLAAGTELIIPGGEVAAAPAKKTASSTGKAFNTQASGVGKALAAPSGYFGNPLPGGILTQGLHGHNAVDIGAPKGTPIYAAADGTVIVAKNDGAWNGGYGSYVVITHPNGTQTLYAHMSNDISTVGESVKKGQLIGYVGMTGEATGNHLHFEVRGAANPFAK